MVELYQDTLVDLLLPKNGKRLKLDIKKDPKVIILMFNHLLFSQFNVNFQSEFQFIGIFTSNFCG